MSLKYSESDRIIDDRNKLINYWKDKHNEKQLELDNNKVVYEQNINELRTEKDNQIKLIKNKLYLKEEDIKKLENNNSNLYSTRLVSFFVCVGLISFIFKDHISHWMNVVTSYEL